MLNEETREKLTSRFVEELQQVLDDPDQNPGEYILDRAVIIGGEDHRPEATLSLLPETGPWLQDGPLQEWASNG